MRRRNPSHADHDRDDDDAPSKSQLKRDMHALQEMGTELLEIPEDQFADIEMPERLRDAFADYRRIPTMEAKRRQMQYIGKLLRTADPDPLRRAVERHRSHKARDVDTLHEAETWRDRILAGDEGWQAWCEAMPVPANRTLHGLVRNARREQAQAADVARERGQAPRKGKLYRELFQKLRAELLARNAALNRDEDAPEDDAERPG